MIKKALVASSIILLSTAAQAEGGYLGLSAGQTDVDISGFDTGTSFSVTGGFKVNSNFSLEASYIDFGESSDSIAPVWTLKSDAINLSAVGLVPITQSVDIFAKMGLLMWNASIDQAGTGEIASDDGQDISLGLGISANLAEHFSIIFEYQKFELDDVDLSNISLGGRYNF